MAVLDSEDEEGKGGDSEGGEAGGMRSEGSKKEERGGNGNGGAPVEKKEKGDEKACEKAALREIRAALRAELLAADHPLGAMKFE